ncbi:hypothetical protein DS745_13295 [Anaerobacillus alkaliphilus]|uniref:Uncharacterized protein n=1 Tax=Anaerobacillus alkaliphilus TaxID=1548597 RepID=A0A4V1LGA1_9BACI|nr:hypothetical protein [Anaerobacillus alkaliphilus]RXI99851.1 hypothetical protein DS745_13295 [Anaerobacillus alkaliphilus]
MSELIVISSIVLFFTTVVITNQYFYHLAMRVTASRFEKKYPYAIEKMSFSFEQMVYLIKLPSNVPHIKNVKKEQIYITYDYSSFLYPDLKGISVNLTTDGKKITLAYLSIDNYRSPVLDKLLKEGHINLETYKKISTYKIKHPKVNELIIHEVYRKLQVGRYNILNETS